MSPETQHVSVLIISSLTYYGFQITTQSLLLRLYDASSPEGLIAKDKIVNTSRDIVDLFREVQAQISRGYFGVYYAQASTISARSIIRYLAEPAIPEIFHMLIVVLISVSRRWAIAQGIIRMIWITVKRHKLDGYLNTSTASLFKLNTIDRWGPQERQQLEACTYPNIADIHEKGRDFVEMGSLLQEYADMQITNDADTSDLVRRPGP